MKPASPFTDPEHWLRVAAVFGAATGTAIYFLQRHWAAYVVLPLLFFVFVGGMKTRGWRRLMAFALYIFIASGVAAALRWMSF